LSEESKVATRTVEAEAIWAFAEHEHHDLVRGIDRIHEIACEIGHRPPSELSVHALGVLQWLDTILEPHVAWEETWLYPEIDARTGTTWATRAARFDHQQIRDLATRLLADQVVMSSHPSGDAYAEARCHLFGLEALLRAHIEREERYLIPMLSDASTPAGRPDAHRGATTA
jgi:hemerythrin-like domain-containing protein